MTHLTLHQSKQIFRGLAIAGVAGLVLTWVAFAVDGYRTPVAGVFSACVTLCALAGASALIIFAGIAPLKKNPTGIGKLRYGLAALIVCFILTLLLNGSTRSVSFDDPAFINLTLAYVGTILSFMQVLSIGVIISGAYDIVMGKQRRAN